LGFKKLQDLAVKLPYRKKDLSKIKLTASF
jgi:hypothetical protein